MVRDNVHARYHVVIVHRLHLRGVVSARAINYACFAPAARDLACYAISGAVAVAVSRGAACAGQILFTAFRPGPDNRKAENSSLMCVRGQDGDRGALTTVALLTTFTSADASVPSSLTCSNSFANFMPPRVKLIILKNYL